MRRTAGCRVGLGVVAMLAGVAGVHLLAGQQKSVQASAGWVKVPAAGETTTTAYMVVENPTQYDIYLVSGATEVAGKVEFREKTQGGETQARKTVTVAAFDSISMDPNGVYLLLTDLKRPLKEGETIPLALTTDSSAVLQVSAVVRKE